MRNTISVGYFVCIFFQFFKIFGLLVIHCLVIKHSNERTEFLRIPFHILFRKNMHVQLHIFPECMFIFQVAPTANYKKFFGQQSVNVKLENGRQ